MWKKDSLNRKYHKIEKIHNSRNITTEKRFINPEVSYREKDSKDENYHMI